MPAPGLPGRRPGRRSPAEEPTPEEGRVPIEERRALVHARAQEAIEAMKALEQ